MILSLTIFVAGLVLWAPSSYGQRAVPPCSSPSISIAVTAVNPKKDEVRGLQLDDFEVFENGRRAKLISVDEISEPLSIGIVIQVADARPGEIDTARKSAIAFVESSDPKNEYFVKIFGSDTETLAKSATAATAISELRESQRFAKKDFKDPDLYDAVADALGELTQSKMRRRVLFLFAGVKDARSKTAAKSVQEMVDGNSIPIFHISYERVDRHSDGFDVERWGTGSGGRSSAIGDARWGIYRSKRYSGDDYLEAVFGGLAKELSSYYRLEFKPTIPLRFGESRTVSVGLRKTKNPEIDRKWTGFRVRKRFWCDTRI